MAGRHLREDAPATTPRRWWILVLALLVGLTIGLLGMSWLMSEDDASVSTSGSDDAGSGGDATATATPDPGPITLAFVGDINTDGVLSTRLAEQPDDFVGPFADLLRSADLAVGNVEAAIVTGDTPLDKEFVFSSPPSILDALAAGGIDVVSAANNHAMDHGAEGLAETLRIKSERPDGSLIGIGATEEDAYAPFLRTIRGHTVAVIAATQMIEPELIGSWTAGVDQGGVASAKRIDRLVAEVEAVRSAADTVVVYLHWGTEEETCPNSSQQELARALVDAGADVIVGTNAHRVQGAGRLDGAFVGYGTGNFLFGAPNEDAARSGVLLVEVDDREVTGYEWRPGRIDDSVPVPLEGDEASTALDQWNELRGCTGLTE